MKKLPNLKRKKVTEDQSSSHITNETLAEHREKVLAGGRRFKYPHQYARHKLVFNAVIISLVTIALFLIVVWWQLYPAQNTGTFMYKFTRIVPVPVATVDGEWVRYSDYLIKLRPTQHYREQTEGVSLDTDNGKKELEFHKRQSLDSAISDAYARKLAKEDGIKVSEAQIDEAIAEGRSTVTGQISEEVYEDSIYSKYGYSPDEYRDILRSALLTHAVAFAVDTQANNARAAAESYLEANKKASLEDVSKTLEKQDFKGIQVASPGKVPKTNIDGGLAREALKLENGEVSSFIRSTTGDGYYLVQLNNSDNRNVDYSYLKISLTEFENMLTEIRDSDKVSEFISVESSSGALVEDATNAQ